MAALVHDRATRGQGWAGERSRSGHEGWVGPIVVAPVPHERWLGVRCRPALAVVAVVALTAVGGALADAAAGAAGARAGARPAAAAEGSPAPTAVGGPIHVVQPGQTYWSIAKGQGGSGDIRARVDALVEANGGRPLEAGDRLVLPDGS